MLFYPDMDLNMFVGAYLEIGKQSMHGYCPVYLETAHIYISSHTNFTVQCYK